MNVLNGLSRKIHIAKKLQIACMRITVLNIFGVKYSVILKSLQRVEPLFDYLHQKTIDTVPWQRMPPGKNPIEHL